MSQWRIVLVVHSGRQGPPVRRESERKGGGTGWVKYLDFPAGGRFPQADIRVELLIDVRKRVGSRGQVRQSGDSAKAGDLPFGTLIRRHSRPPGNSWITTVSLSMSPLATRRQSADRAALSMRSGFAGS